MFCKPSNLSEQKCDLNKINIYYPGMRIFLASYKVALPIKFGFWRLGNVEILIGTFTLFCIAVLNTLNRMDIWY
jgi:hypothetical protein